MSDSIWYKLGKATGKGLVYLALAVATAGLSTLFHTDDEETPESEEHPTLSDELYRKLVAKDGKWGADRAKRLVESGEWKAEHLERALNRPDIDPEDWRDFEDGWSPEGW